MKKIIYLASILGLLLSCNDDEEIFNSETKDVSINFLNTINSEIINLDSNTYQNSAGEEFSINELKYIISNIEFEKENGDVFRYPVEDGYFLINQENNDSKFITLKNIPIENFKILRLGIGIDQSNYPLNGVDNFVPTAEESGMLWSWSAGYIFFKMEGNYSVNQVQSPFLFHIGSHGTNLDNYKVVELSSQEPFLNLNQQNLISIKADLLKVFNATHDIQIQDKPDVQIDPENAPKIAENVSQMFSLVSVFTTH
ncbi:MbnP family protein [Psychroflexus tropicus]|uniref:MbnP family protein n=1 Tax=Psychroflexus tropicus TaxID=197345 RepID=UPI00036B677E|nr:MbnP family protein [Psychroflexus tropicus]